MNLYIKQHVFTWGDKFSIYDENGNEKYYVEGEVFTFGKKLHLYDTAGTELAFIEQQLFTFRPRYYISKNGNLVAEIIKEFTLFCQEYSVSGPDWHVSGDFFSHDYTVTDESEHTIASVSKEWFTFGDAYELRISDDADEIIVLAVCLVIDACIDASRNND